MKNPRLLQTTKTMLATVALTGLMAGSAARLHATTTGNPFGWQPSWPLKCREDGKNVHAGSGDCTERMAVQELFQVGLQHHPTYLELLVPIGRANTYDDLIKQAYTQVMGQ